MTEAWWLQTGTEQCGSCLLWFHYEEQYRCDECDTPMCTFCAHFTAGERMTRCVECRPEGGEED